LYLSYPAGSACNTYHIQNRAPGSQSYCLGQFQAIIQTLLATGQIAQLINVVKNYIESSNVDSPHCYPDHETMNIKAPGVTDDSFKVWEANNETKRTYKK
jgi:hypothetical protein